METPCGYRISDLVASQAYQDYVHATPELFALRFNTIDVARFSANYRLQNPITVNIGDSFYVDIRVLMSYDIFDELQLPQAYFMRYVCLCEYTRWIGKDKKLIEVFCPMLETKLTNWSSLEVYMHGCHTSFHPDTMIMITEALCIRHPYIIPSHSRKQLLKRFKSRATQAIPVEGEGAVL